MAIPRAVTYYASPTNRAVKLVWRELDRGPIRREDIEEKLVNPPYSITGDEMHFKSFTRTARRLGVSREDQLEHGFDMIFYILEEDGLIENTRDGFRKTPQGLFIQAFGEKVWRDHEIIRAAAETAPAGKRLDAQLAAVLADELMRAGVKVDDPSALKELQRRASSRNPGDPLIAECQKLWEHYCARPGKKRLREVLSHLETMKASKSAKVKLERRRCLRAANQEAKGLGI